MTVSRARTAARRTASWKRLVELRYAGDHEPDTVLDAATTQLRITWSANHHHTYTIPVVQVANPTWTTDS